jgi:hypothetical protein
VTEEIIWKDPPKVKRGSAWENRLSPLLDHPNRWALVHVAGSSSVAAQLRKRMYSYPAGKWEFRQHSTPEGNEVYARYLGPTEEGE